MNSKLFNKSDNNYDVTSPYGMRDITELGLYNNYHIGTDYKYPQGTELITPLAGVVLKEITWGDYGGQVFVYLPAVDKTLHYAHVTRIDVKQGQELKAGQVIGLSGGAKGTNGSGTSTGAHLHIGMASGKVTSVGKGTMGDGLWTDIDRFDFFPKKDLEAVAKKVANGDYGNGQARKDNLAKEGFTDAEIKEIQAIVNKNEGVKPQQKPKPQPQPKPMRVNAKGNVRLFVSNTGNATYPYPSQNKYTNIKSRNLDVIRQSGNRVEVRIKGFSPEVLWLDLSDVTKL